MKKYLGIFALILAIAGSAFTTRNSIAAPKLVGQWYLFNGDPNNPSEVADPVNYSLESYPICPGTGSKRCEVNAEPGSGDHPDLLNIYIIRNKP